MGVLPLKRRAAVFAVTERADFDYLPPSGSFVRHLCSGCGEYASERYTCLANGKHVCIPCSGYDL